MISRGKSGRARRTEGAEAEKPVRIRHAPRIEKKIVARVDNRSKDRSGNLGVALKTEEGDLIALLDQGKLDDFRRQLRETELERRRRMFVRVMAIE